MGFWLFILEALEAGQRIMLLVVLDSQGSSPGRKGFKLAVRPDGRTFGTIGGGVMEHALVKRALTSLLQASPQPFLLLQQHDPNATENRSGMICSGRQSVAFLPLGGEALPVIREICACLEQKQVGRLRLGPESFTFSPGQDKGPAISSQIGPEQQWVYEELLGLPDELYIIGGGHIGLALCRQFHLLDFRITVLDNRPELHFPLEPELGIRLELADYNHLAQRIPEGPNVYVVIASASHHSDGRILGQLLGKDVRYLGMLGSKNKVSTIFDLLRSEGATDEQLARVCAPIGLPIQSHTPAEIAVSIAAQVVQVKNG